VGEGVGFGDVPNAVTLLDSTGGAVARASGSKLAVAHALLDAVVALRGGRGAVRPAD
jgi:phosphopantothenoylcysteine decarboxylase/phosphopantothenate--cysteine ligase